MKAIILLLLIAVLPIKASPQSGWKTFVSEEGGFAVTFPEEPTGDSNESGMRYKVDLGPRTFGVVCAKDFTRAESPEKTLNNNANEFMKTCKGTLIKKSPISKTSTGRRNQPSARPVLNMPRSLSLSRSPQERFNFC